MCDFFKTYPQAQAQRIVVRQGPFLPISWVLEIGVITLSFVFVFISCYLALLCWRFGLIVRLFVIIFDIQPLASGKARLIVLEARREDI